MFSASLFLSKTKSIWHLVISPFSSLSPSTCSPAISHLQQLLSGHLTTTLRPRSDRREGSGGGERIEYDRELALVSFLKACASDEALFPGQQVHAFIQKSGLGSNSYVKNSLINLYAKCGSMAAARFLFESDGAFLDPVSCNIMISGHVKLGSLMDAHEVFKQMPSKGCVSYTTMMIGFTKNNRGIEAVQIFRDMQVEGLVPNEVTVASLISAYVQLGSAIGACRMLHGLLIKLMLHSFVIVSTNLLNMYCISSSLSDARNLFEEMPERNLVSWNVMLNGYSKSGLVCLARDLFCEIPYKDVVSWGTMINGYIQVGMIREGLIMCSEMLQSGLKPNDVMLVDLVSACARSTAVVEGQQLHGMVIRCGFNCYDFVQATIIHFYATCGLMDLACLQYNIGFKDHVASINALMAGFVRNGMISQARTMFDEMPKKDIFSWSTIISGYVRHEEPATALELFYRMISSGLLPNEVTMVSVFNAIAALGSLSEGEWALDYVMNNTIPISNNLSASVIDMYSKCGSIDSALEVFYRVRDLASDVSPWNAIICGLAMHGHADLSLELFSDLQGRQIKLNSVTFIGVLMACCHSGLVEEGERYFKNMKTVYNVEPDVEHYGCMVDMLGRAGRVKEASELVENMPMKADVAIWGALLAACRTHGYVEIGEKAVKKIAELEPSHGPCRVMLSNLYAGAGRWNDAFLARKALSSQELERWPGFSGVI
ncbi:hypothetical protein SAY86_000511 [Trapa natans]|uniref:Pentatricopeptide repeat-containing protein n=1 Tax=Trapa natans TaxID=22666 RepID=A0AAN7RMZ3_TRANT|nr:hypothetical protein SAY86_000511 [Trapa natans]